MTTGAIFPSYIGSVSWTATSGAWSTAYPLGNVTDLVRISNVARASAAGAREISGLLSSPQSVRALALIGHNLTAGNIRVYAFSGTANDPVANAATIVYDSGSVPIWPSGGPVDGYRSIRPFIFPAVTARSFRIVLPAGSDPLEVGAIEVGGFWEWPGVDYGREQGVMGGDDDVDLIGGASMPGTDNPARFINASIDLMKMSITSTTGLDFQKGLDIQTPFVWSESFEDAATWARKCILVRNRELPGISGRLYRHDAFPVRLVEHLR